jgi:hypothetical protein
MVLKKAIKFKEIVAESRWWYYEVGVGGMREV